MQIRDISGEVERKNGGSLKEKTGRESEKEMREFFLGLCERYPEKGDIQKEEDNRSFFWL